MSEPQVILAGVAPMRAEPRERAEQVSQAIAGEMGETIEERDGWIRIRTADSYDGWVHHRHCARAADLGGSWPPDASRRMVVRQDVALLFAGPSRESPPLTRLPMGAVVEPIPGCGTAGTANPGWARVRAPLRAEEGARLQEGWTAAEALQQPAPDGAFCPEEAARLAVSLVGVPYLWGGVTPFGFDCSGFVQRIYSMQGILLQRDAYLQAQSELGERLEQGRWEQGDLVFFRGAEDPRQRGITHVGMALSADRFVHSVGIEGVCASRFEDPFYRTRYEVRGGWRCLRRV